MIQSVLSLEYVRVPIAAKEAGVAIVPTADVVRMAFTAADVDPVTLDWQVSAWESDTSTIPTTYLARCLVGPAGTITLTVGVYDVWVKITDSPEIPARRAGTLEIV